MVRDVCRRKKHLIEDTSTYPIYSILDVNIGRNLALTSMTPGDALQLSKIVALTAISWCVPPRYWRKVVRPQWAGSAKPTTAGRFIMLSWGRSIQRLKLP